MTEQEYDAIEKRLTDATLVKFAINQCDDHAAMIKQAVAEKQWLHIKPIPKPAHYDQQQSFIEAASISDILLDRFAVQRAKLVEELAKL